MPTGNVPSMEAYVIGARRVWGAMASRGTHWLLHWELGPSFQHDGIEGSIWIQAGPQVMV